MCYISQNSNYIKSNYNTKEELGIVKRRKEIEFYKKIFNNLLIFNSIIERYLMRIYQY